MPSANPGRRLWRSPAFSLSWPLPRREDSRLPSALWRVKILLKEMQRIENYLKVRLQAFGAVTALALVPFVMPRSWMAAVHEWLGMGMLPDRPVVEYLARTTSALYGYLGGLYLVLATDVRRYARVITYCAVATIPPVHFDSGIQSLNRAASGSSSPVQTLGPGVTWPAGR